MAVYRGAGNPVGADGCLRAGTGQERIRFDKGRPVLAVAGGVHDCFYGRIEHHMAMDGETRQGPSPRKACVGRGAVRQAMADDGYYADLLAPVLSEHLSGQLLL